MLEKLINYFERKWQEVQCAGGNHKWNHSEVFRKDVEQLRECKHCGLVESWNICEGGWGEHIPMEEIPVISALYCEKCKAIVYSRHVHDFRWCPCEDVAIDGGQDYTRIIYNGKPPPVFKIALLPEYIKGRDLLSYVSLAEIRKDYANSTDKFGVIPYDIN